MRFLPGAPGDEPIDEIGSEANAYDDVKNGEAQGHGKGDDSSGKAPHEYFAGKSLTPARWSAAGVHARKQSRKKARDASAKGTEGFALRSGKRRFFAKDQAMIENEQAERNDEPSGAAGHESDAGAEKYATDVEWIANMAVGTVGDKIFRVQRVVVDDFAVEIGGSPGTNQRGENAEHRAKSENQMQSAHAGGRVEVQGFAAEQMRDGESGRDVVEGVAEKAEAENTADAEEALAEFKFGGTHHENATHRADKTRERKSFLNDSVCRG